MGLRLSELMNIPSLQDVHVVTGESLLETKKLNGFLSLNYRFRTLSVSMSLFYHRQQISGKIQI